MCVESKEWDWNETHSGMVTFNFISEIRAPRIQFFCSAANARALVYVYARENGEIAKVFHNQSDCERVCNWLARDR